MIGSTNSKFIILPKDNYNYGDGSLNTVNNGYVDKIAINGDSNLWEVGTPYYGTSNYPSLSVNKDPVNSSQDMYDFKSAKISLLWESEIRAQKISNGKVYDWSPIRGKVTSLLPFDASGTNYKTLVKSGTNNWTFEPITGEKTVCIFVSWGGGSGSKTISNLLFTHKGQNYTLKELVENKIIKPLVLISNGGLSSYNCPALNLYDNSASCQGSFSNFAVLFMTNAESEITSMGFTNNTAFNTTYDGAMMGMTDINNFRLTYVDDETPL